jgi:ribosomal-protein-alanine N-acetyltransferase
MELETERLLLRPPAASDVDDYIRFMSDPDVVRYLGDGAVKPPEDIADTLASHIVSHERDGYGLCTVLRKRDGAFLGRVGLLVWNAATWRPTTAAEAFGPTETEVGWAIAREHWGRGYATEAALAVRDFALGELGLTRLISLIQQGNAASIRVAEKLGERLEQRHLHGFSRPTDLYALQR